MGVVVGVSRSVPQIIAVPGDRRATATELNPNTLYISAELPVQSRSAPQRQAPTNPIDGEAGPNPPEQPLSWLVGRHD